MRKIAFLTALAVTSIANPALAQDDDKSWTGAYVGISAGYTDAKSDQSVALSNSWTSETAPLQSYVTGFYPSNTNVQDVNYGGQLGYNYQTRGGFVVGLEADVSGLPGKDTVTKPLTPSTPFPALSYAVTNTFNPKATYGIKAKLGFATGNTLLYATGGWGWTSADIALDITSNGGYHKTANLSHTFDGWELGGGVEQRLGHNLSVRLDYTYADHGDFTYTTSYAAGSSFAPPAFNYTETFTQDLRMHLVRLGLNLHF